MLLCTRRVFARRSAYFCYRSARLACKQQASTSAVWTSDEEITIKSILTSLSSANFGFCGSVHGDEPWSGNSSDETHFPTGSAARSPCSSVLTVQQITPTVPTPRANGIIRSKVQYAGFCTGRWMTISQPSIWTSPPAKDDQFVAICDHAQRSRERRRVQ